MLTNLKRTSFRTLVIIFGTLIVAQSALAQPTQTSKRTTITRTTRGPLTGAENEIARQILTRLRGMRDCWVDPYVMLPSKEPKSAMAFYSCGSEYALRLAEAQAAAEDADAVNSPSIKREATAAMAVFNDLEILQQFFNRSNLASFLEVTLVSDIYPIIRKYNIAYKQNVTTKGEIYRQMMPHRRVHIDRLASLIADPPLDPNPTLTPAQAAAATDDLTWSRAQRDMLYEWYLDWYPQGRHAVEARKSIARKDEIKKQRNDELETIRQDLERTTRRVLEAYVRGDKATYASYLSSRFPARQIYVAKLKPQPDVASFEIRDFQVHRLHNGQDLYRATMNVLYRSVFNMERQYRNSLLYLKSDRGWEIVEWR